MSTLSSITLGMSLWYRRTIHTFRSQPFKPSSLSISVLSNVDVVPAHHPFLHDSIRIKRPMFDPIASFPLHAIKRILILVPKLHSDLVVSEGKKFLTEKVVLLLYPFLLKELDDGGMPSEEVISVAPNGVGGISGFDTMWVTELEMSRGFVVGGMKARMWRVRGRLPSIPEFLGEFDFLVGGLQGERRLKRHAWFSKVGQENIVDYEVIKRTHIAGINSSYTVGFSYGLTTTGKLHM